MFVDFTEQSAHFIAVVLGIYGGSVLLTWLLTFIIVRGSRKRALISSLPEEARQEFRDTIAERDRLTRDNKDLRERVKVLVGAQRTIAATAAGVENEK